MCRIAVRGDGKAGSPKHHKAHPSKHVLSSIAGWLAAIRWPLDRLSAIDAWVCDTLKQHIRPLVSAGLIATTLLGALLLSAFFTAQIGVHLHHTSTLRLTQPSGTAGGQACLDSHA